MTVLLADELARNLAVITQRTFVESESNVLAPLLPGPVVPGGVSLLALLSAIGSRCTH